MPYSTTELLPAVKRYRNGREFVAFLTMLFCPRVITFGTKTVQMDKVLRNKVAAPFVSPLIAGKVQRQQGFATYEYQPPYVKPKDAVEPEQFMERLAGEDLYGTMSPADRLNLTRMDLISKQYDSIAIREEIMVAEMIQSGQITCVSEEHPLHVIDFEPDAANNITLTGAARWSQLSADSSQPVEDLETWADACKVAPNVLLFGSNKAYRKFASFNEIKETIDNQINETSGSGFNLAASTGEYIQRKGTYGDYQLIVYTGAYDDEQGNSVRLLDENRMIMCSSSNQGAILYGAIQDLGAMMPMARYPKNWTQEDPSMEFVMTQSAPLPVLPSINDIVSVDLGD